MEFLRYYGPTIFWIVVFGVVAAALYFYFERRDQKKRRPRSQREDVRHDPSSERRPSAPAPAPEHWQPAPPVGPRSTPASTATRGTAPSAAQTPDPRRATELAVSVLPPNVPYQHRATPNAIPFFWSGRWHVLSIKNPQEWGWGVFGATRSGKGNFLQLVALTGLGLGPDACHVWVLDPKTGLDYGFCLHLEHARLYADGIVADGSLLAGYEAAVVEMQRRNAILHAAGARNVIEYHQQGNPPLPYLLIIADEVGQLDGRQRALLDKLAAMSAASGMLLFVSTQYPTTEYLSSQVQINLQNRLVFRLASPRYTEVALSLAKGERSGYDPSAITAPGVAIFRRGGQETLGRVPEITDQLRQGLIEALRLQWPRQHATDSSEEAELDTLLAAIGVRPLLEQELPAPPSKPANGTAVTPALTESHLKIAAWLTADPSISNREIARRLNPGTDGGGDAAVKAKKLRQQVEAVLGGVLGDPVRGVRDVRSDVEEGSNQDAEHRTEQRPDEE
jgi:hypothetical protein